jgi:two-component system response regulator HydG
VAADNVGLAGPRLHHRSGLGELLGESAEMQAIYTLIEKASQHTFSVIILGESGTGKELVARAIHYLGPRARFPFTPVDCSALSPTLIESELFGHTRGSFTGATNTTEGLFQISHKGTVFMDEIGELPIHLQAKLLRVIQERSIRPIGSTAEIPIDIRTIAATNRNLKSAILDGKFRQDLYFRLNVVQIEMPPLRERKGDIPQLANLFLERFTGCRGPTHTISDDAMRLLLVHDWPGNVRELENVIQRAVALSSASAVQTSDLPPSVRNGSPHYETENIDEILQLNELEQVAILRALRETEGDTIAAARLLGIGKTTIYRRLKRYGQDTPRRQGRWRTKKYPHMTGYALETRLERNIKA